MQSFLFQNSQRIVVVATPYKWGSFLIDRLHDLSKSPHSPLGTELGFKLHPLDTKASPRRVPKPWKSCLPDFGRKRTLDSVF